MPAFAIIDSVYRMNYTFAVNQFAAAGEDPDWQRGETAFDQQTAGDGSRGLSNSCLAPLTEGPFYGAPIWPGVLGTKGGLRINARAQVVDVWGEPIPGLYAVGNCTGSVMGAGYPGGGAVLHALSAPACFAVPRGGISFPEFVFREITICALHGYWCW